MKKVTGSISRRKPSSDRDRAEEIATLTSRIAFLEVLLDQLSWQRFYAHRPSKSRGRSRKAPTPAQVRFVRATSDGWLLVKIGGQTASLPSGLQVSLTSTSGGRDYGTVGEGQLAGQSFDVASGNLVTSYRRTSSLKIKVTTRPGGPIVIDGTEYELNISMTYSEDGSAKSLGPFAAKTDPANPLPTGNHPVEIADYPHPGGSTYGAHGTVWFRLGTSGDRYLHPGKFSAGCMTCAPGNWENIYDVVHCARKNPTTAGDLNFTPSTIAVAVSASKRRKAPA